MADASAPAAKKAKTETANLPNGNADLQGPLAPPHVKHHVFGGRILIMGFGSIGRGILPLVIKHMDMPPSKITVLTMADREAEAKISAERYGTNVVVAHIKKDNFKEVLTPLIGEGDFLMNVTVDTGSCDLMEFCSGIGCRYLDTVVEPWPGGYDDPNLTPSQRSNYFQRDQMMALRAKLGPDSPTQITTHGANPGLVSHFVKQALLNIAKDTGVETAKPATREEWGALAQKLGVKTIHIAERDNQVGLPAKEVGEFVNTWSVAGFISEGCQPAELGWGTHEKALPHDGAHHEFGCNAAIYLNRPGCLTKVRTWTPTEGPFHGFLVTHNESISIADYFTVSEGGKNVYRPTVHYAYHPCDQAVLSLHELAGKNYKEQERFRLLDEHTVVSGIDELGVLIGGHAKGAYWYGSQLANEKCHEMIEHNAATSLQVTATAVAGMIWALENPHRGICEPDEMDFERILEIAQPYCEPVVGAYTDWTPLVDREVLFSEDVDKEDPWQFKNVRVV